MDNLRVSARERRHLRELAKRQLEYSRLPVMRKREKAWYRHNDLKGEKPLLHFEARTFENEILPPLKCQSQAGRAIELQLNRNMVNHERIGDDSIVLPYFAVRRKTSFSLFGLRIESERSRDSQGRDVGYQFRHPVKDFAADVPLRGKSTFGVDVEATAAWRAFAEDVLGDILPVRFEMPSPGFFLSKDIVLLMGMEAMMYAIIDHPGLFHRLSRRITEDHINYMKWLQDNGLLVLNNDGTDLLQGSFGFTEDLPPGGSWTGMPGTGDLWGFMDSQETVCVSPAMFGEFFFPHYLEFAGLFGLLSYGCCEPVHALWEPYLSKLPNLRKISVSPWCDERFMGEALKDSGVIYHRKPSPNLTGVGREFDEDAFKKHILETINCARGCKLEISFRGVYALEGNLSKPRRAVEITRELIEDHWG